MGIGVRNGNDEVWTRAHEALTAGRWVEAREALEALLSYWTASATDELPLVGDRAGTWRDAINDRVAAWNAAVRRCVLRRNLLR